MGDLVRMPHSEVTATLEILDRFGVKPEHLAKFRSASSAVQSAIARKLIHSHYRNLEVWKTITLSAYPSLNRFHRAIKKEEGYFEVDQRANQLLRKVDFSRARTEMDVVIRSVRELGFIQNEVRRDAIYARAREQFGLQLCIAEVGPVLRLAYGDQAYGEHLLVAMEPIRDAKNERRIFGLSHLNGARWLCADYGESDCVWDLDDRWVFALPRQ